MVCLIVLFVPVWDVNVARLLNSLRVIHFFTLT